MNGQSLDIKQDKIELLKKAFPEIFTEGDRIDFDQLKETLGESIEHDTERYGLTWAGKSRSFHALQTPTTATLRPEPEQSVDFAQSNNLFIEGDNLEVLKVLQKAYYKRVKMIYIDPPYNTGNDFVYHDDFATTQDAYRHASGELDESGHTRKAFRKNAKENGHYHSDWLTMLYPRLFLSRNLLREDGVIFVSIDDHEVHNLRLIMNEIFGEENFVADIIWNSTKSVTNTALVSVAHTHNIVFAKDIDYWTEHRQEFRLPESGEGFENPDNDPRGPWKADPFQVGGWRPNQQYEITNPKTGEVYKPSPGNSWKNDHKKFQELLVDNRIVFGSTGEAGPQRKRFLSEALDRGRVTTTLWSDIETTTNGTQTLKSLLGGNYFTNPKPISLIKRFLELSTKKENDDIILDFFAGSGTTGQAVMELNQEDGGNRKFILVQLPEAVEAESEAGKAGYATIADITRERLRRVIEKLKRRSERSEEPRPFVAGITAPGSFAKAQDDILNFKSFRLAPSNWKIWRGDDIADEATLLARLNDRIDNITPGAQAADMVYELLLKQGIPPTATIEDRGAYQRVGDTVVCLAEPMTEAIAEAIIAEKPTVVMCIDRAFHGRESLKTNTALQMRDAGIEFKVI
jgi:adenine-specific DNA-methyltransferase